MLTIADVVLAHALSLAKLWRIATDIEKKKSFIKRGSFKKYVRSNLPIPHPRKKINFFVKILIYGRAKNSVDTCRIVIE